MNKKIVILTKSAKFGKLCVAGIDLDTGTWVRLVSTDEATHGALDPEDLQFENGSCAKLLDVINVEILGNDSNEAQPENVVINRGHYVDYLDSITIESAVSRFRGRKEDFIFGNTSYYVDEESVKSLGRSLELIEAENLEFKQLVNNAGQPKTKLEFKYNGNYYSNMSVTDPEFYDVEHGPRIDRAILVVSIGTPYNGRCYKFVSAIYPLE